MSKVDAISYEGLYTPQSYLDAREARRIIAQLEAVLEMEKSQERALDDIAERYKTKIESLDRSEEYKRKFLKGFDEGLDEVKTAIRKLESITVHAKADLIARTLSENLFGEFP